MEHQSCLHWPGTRLFLTFRRSPPQETVALEKELKASDGLTLTGPKHWFNIDQVLRYQPFHADFGPMNLAMLYRFCLLVHELEREPELKGFNLVMWTKLSPHKMANGALLMSLYVMMLYKCSPADAFAPLAGTAFMPFRDAGYGRADFDLSIMDALYGIHKAMKAKLLRLDGFDIEEYEKYERVENGDFNWITPHFIAFASPSDALFNPASAATKGPAQAFANVLRYFEANNVQMIVRLNEPLYDRMRFVENGMDHVDMHFPDGTCPELDVVRDFVDKADRVITEQKGVIAVHCKAGLGRTGCLIGAWLIYTFSFTAREVIAFMRVLRPGMCVGPQQHWLYQHEMTFIGWNIEKTIRSELEGRYATGSASPAERPLTPPMESAGELIGKLTDVKQRGAMAPSTPRRQILRPIPVEITTPIPGQPRKTPARTMKSAPRLRGTQLSPKAEHGESASRSHTRVVSAPRASPLAESNNGTIKAKLTKEALQQASGGGSEDDVPTRYNLRKSTSAQSLHGENNTVRPEKGVKDSIPPVPTVPVTYNTSPAKTTNIPRPAKKRAAPPMSPRAGRRVSSAKRQVSQSHQQVEISDPIQDVEDSGKESDELAIKSRPKSALPISVRPISNQMTSPAKMTTGAKPGLTSFSSNSDDLSDSSSSSLTLGPGPSTPTRPTGFASYMSTPPIQSLRNTASQIFRAAMGTTPKRETREPTISIVA